MSDAAAFSHNESHGGGALSAAGKSRQARTLVLLPASEARDEAPNWSEARFADAPAGPETAGAKGMRGRWRAAASLAAVVMIGAAAAGQMHVVGEERAQAQALGRRLDAIAAQLQTIEAGKPRDDIAGLKKTLADIKAGTASAHDLGGAVGALTARVDRLEKDQSNHLDRVDKDSTQRLADIAQRLEKLETRPITAAPVKTDVAKAAPGVSLEPTGAIDKPKPRLRNFYLADIRNGYAMIGGPQGEFAVAPGDNVPGGGRVLRIERHGRDWVVVTTLGQIASVDY